MPKRFDLRSKFEVEGVFWRASSPSDRFSGHLSATARGIELSTGATISNAERFFAGTDPDGALDVIHGWTTLGVCTLVELHGIKGPQHLDGKTGDVLSIRRLRVSLCIMGVHLRDPFGLFSASIECTYIGLDNWLRPTSEIRLSEEEVSVRYPRRALRLLDFCVLSTKIGITLSVGSDVALSSSGRHSAASRTRITIAPTEPTSLEQLLDVAYHFEDFLSLFLGISVRLRSVSCDIAGEGEGWFVRRQRGRVEKHDIQASFRCDLSQLSGAIAAWLSATDELRPVQNLVYGTVRDSAMSAETEFLSLAQGLESFHRLTDRSALVPASIFRRICDVLVPTIAAVCNNHALAERLEDAIRFANEPSFKKRIESLITRIRPDHAELLLGDPIEFEQTLRQTRNFFTHLGIKRQSKVITTGGDLFLFNQKLHAFLRLLMLLNVGFPEELVFGSVRYQSRKWTLF